MSIRAKKTLKRLLVALSIVLAAALCLSIWYVNDYEHADAIALACVADKDGPIDGVEVKLVGDSYIAFVPEHASCGLVFYPGAKIQPEAYAPLMQDCARQGILCVIVKPTFNLALLSIDAASGAVNEFPEVTRWIMAGHSMGGVAACEYVAAHPDDAYALALLAAYPAADLSGFRGNAVTLIGTEDLVLNRKSYENARPNLPKATREIVIQGGNHAGFGNYGAQNNDGVATISPEEQQKQTADAIESLANP